MTAPTLQAHEAPRPGDGASPFEALESLAARLAAGATDADTYDRAAKTLVRCLDPTGASGSSAYQRWAEAPKRAFLARLLLQDTCGARPNILLHTACSHASAGVTWVMPAIAREVAPTIKRALETAPPPLDAVLGLVTLREFLSDTYTQAEISRLHLDNFHRFEREDLALPYSCVFTPTLYQRNREDLLRAATGNDPDRKLGLLHLLLIEWLTTQEPTATGGAAMLSIVGAHLAADDSRSRSDDELSAGRSLLARHITASQLSEARDIIARLGGGPTFADTLSMLSAGRARLVESLRGRPSVVLGRLGKLSAYQVAHVAKNEVRSRMGRGFPGLRRPRVALCVSGQLRGYRHALSTWKEKLLLGIDCDVYVHSWEHIGHSGAEPSRKTLPFQGNEVGAVYREQCLDLGFGAVKERYPSLFAELSKCGTVTEAELRQLYGTDAVVVENDRSEKFAGWSNSKKMHYKIFACSEMAFAGGKQYDLVIRLRPDMPITHVGFGWHDVARRCRSEPVLFSENLMSVHYGTLVAGDQFAMGAPEAMRIFASTYQLHTELSQHGFHKFPSELSGHVSLAYVCWLHGLGVDKVPVKWQPLRDPEALSSAKLLSVLEADAASRNDAWDRRMIAAVRTDLGSAR